jgi:hypothetical protein
MIAVFSHPDIKFREHLTLMPSDNFVTIRDRNDLSGIKFTGLILYLNCGDCEKIADAVKILEQRQPELFK